METLNSIMFEKFMDDEISASTFCNLMTTLESANSDAKEQFEAMRPQAKAAIKEIRTAIKKKDFKDAGKKIEDINKYLDECIDKLKEIKNTADDPIAEAVFGYLRVYIRDLCVALLSILTTPIGALIISVSLYIDEIKDIVDAVNSYKRGENINPYIDRLIRGLTKFKVRVKRLAKEVSAINPDEVGSVKESADEDSLDLITNLYAEGVIDDDTYIDLITESDDEDEETECYDKAIEILTKLKEKPGDKKLTEKLKDVLDDCCECDEKDDKKAEEKKDDDEEPEEAEAPAEEEEVAEESTIVIESEDPVVAEIMESVESMVADLDYASAIMESDLMMTESTDVLKSVMTDVKARLAGVGNMLKELKAKVVDVSDNGARAKIAKILNDLAKRFTALAGTAKEKIAGLANASNKTPDALNA